MWALQIRTNKEVKMAISNLMKDSITILKKNRKELGPVKASVQSDKIFVMSSEILIEPNDLVKRRMSNGGTETFQVIDPCFNEARLRIQAHYQMRVKKLGIEEAEKATQSITYNVSMSGNNARFNNNSTDNSMNTSNSSSINNDIEALKSAIRSINDPSIDKEELIGIASEIKQQIANQKPNKIIIRALLAYLPPIANITSIVESISSCITKYLR